MTFRVSKLILPMMTLHFFGLLVLRFCCGNEAVPLNDSFFSYLYIVTRNCFQIARRVRILITHESCQEVGVDFLSTSGFKSKEKVHEFCWTEAVRIFF